MLSRGLWEQTNSNTQVYGPREIGRILQECGITVGTELDTHYLIYCPFHYNVNSPACEVDKGNGLFICFSCGERGSIYDIVMHTTSRNYFEASRFIAKLHVDTDISDEITNRVSESQENEYDESIVYRLHNTLLNTQDAVDYFHSRGISHEAIAEFKLGYSNVKDMVTVPVQSVSGEYVGHVGRSITEKRFKNSHGLPRKYNLFNLNRSKYNVVAVVESSFDAIRLWQLGIPSVATLGATITMQQIELLNKWTDGIFVIPDADDAGNTMIEKIQKHCYKPMTIVTLPDGIKDIGDMSDSQIKECLEGINVLALPLGI